jgi:hypothetical protein
MSRRNVFIRTVAAFAGDFAVGFSMAVACSWIIQAAALGLFLSFLLWLLGLILSLALSQYVVHPLATALLSDRKLDRGIELLSSLSRAAGDLGLTPGTWQQLRRRFAL